MMGATAGQPFLPLSAFILPPPLPAIVTFLMVCGIATLGWRLARRLRGTDFEAVDAAAGFIVVAAIVAAVVHGLALAQLAKVPILRPLAWGIAALGAYGLMRHRADIKVAARREAEGLWRAPWFERAGAVAVALTMLGLA